jgi:hypothetical protein
MADAATAAAPVFSPPGAFGLGDDNTNACPQGLVPMANESACQSAVTVAGSPYTYSGSIAFNYLPKGCVWFAAGGSFYFNTGVGMTSAPWPFANRCAIPCCGALHVCCWCTLYRHMCACSIPESPCVCPPFPLLYGHRNEAARTNVLCRSRDSRPCTQPTESIRARQRRRLPAAPVPDHDCSGMRECCSRRRQTVPWQPRFALHAERLLLAHDRRQLLLQQERIRLWSEPRRTARVRRCAWFVWRPNINASRRAVRPL